MKECILKDLFCVIMIGVVGLIAGIMFFFFRKNDIEDKKYLEWMQEKIEHLDKEIDRIDRRLQISGCLLR